MRSRYFPSVLAVLAILLEGINFPVRAQNSSTSLLSDQTWVRLGGPLGGLGYDIRMRPDNPDLMYVTDAWQVFIRAPMVVRLGFRRMMGLI